MVNLNIILSLEKPRTNPLNVMMTSTVLTNSHRQTQDNAVLRINLSIIKIILLFQGIVLAQQNRVTLGPEAKGPQAGLARDTCVIKKNHITGPLNGP